MQDLVASCLDGHDEMLVTRAAALRNHNANSPWRGARSASGLDLLRRPFDSNTSHGPPVCLIRATGRLRWAHLAIEMLLRPLEPASATRAAYHRTEG